MPAKPFIIVERDPVPFFGFKFSELQSLFDDPLDNALVVDFFVFAYRHDKRIDFLFLQINCF
jgi:hypothetical protein